MFNVVCLKYGKKYDSSHVNALYDGVKNNLSIDHRFICFTDDPTNVNCETLPIPSNEIGWWGKLSLFKRSLYDLEGTVLFIDLDMHINGSLDEYMSIGDDSDLYIMRDFRWKTEYSSAIMRFPVGKYNKIWEHYIDIKEQLSDLKTGDQNIINIVYNNDIRSARSKMIEHLRPTDQNVDIKFWPGEWQEDVREFMKCAKSDAKVIVGYGSSNIFDLKWFKK